MKENLDEYFLWNGKNVYEALIMIMEFQVGMKIVIGHVHFYKTKR